MSGARDPGNRRLDVDPLQRLAGADPVDEIGPLTAGERRAADDLLARLLAEPVASAGDDAVTPADPSDARPPAGVREWRRWRLDPGRVTAAGLALVAALCALVLADPFGSDGDGSVLERAAAAIGDGPVVHLVTELRTGAALVDLDSGARRPLPLVTESWFDPRRGTRTTARVDGTVVEEHGTPLGGPIRRRQTAGWLEVFLRDYREALRDGSARVLREDEVDGEPVYWLRIAVGGRSRTVASCDRVARACRDVAISRESYEPLYVGPTGASAGEPRTLRVVEVETLQRAAVPVPGRDRQAGLGFDTQPRRPVDRATATRLLGGRLVWPGARIAGLRLARLNESGFRTYEFTSEMRRPRYGPIEPVVRFVYGSPSDVESGRGPRAWDPVLVIQQAPKSGMAVQIGPSLDALNGTDAGPALPGYLPAAGKAVVGAGGYVAVLRLRGIPVMVMSSSPEIVTDAIAALRRAP